MALAPLRFPLPLTPAKCQPVWNTLIVPPLPIGTRAWRNIRPKALTTWCPVAKIAKPEKQFPIFQLAQALRPDTRRLIRHSPTRGRQPKLAQPSPDRRLPSSWGPALASLAPNDRGVVANLPNL